MPGFFHFRQARRGEQLLTLWSWSLARPLSYQQIHPALATVMFQACQAQQWTDNQQKIHLHAGFQLPGAVWLHRGFIFLLGSVDLPGESVECDFNWFGGGTCGGAIKTSLHIIKLLICVYISIWCKQFLCFSSNNSIMLSLAQLEYLADHIVILAGHHLSTILTQNTQLDSH